MRITSVICFLLLNSIIFAQRGELSGKVYSGEGEPLAGANIYFQTLQTGTSTDSAGFFRIKLPLGIHSFVISYIGYQSVTRSINLSEGAGKQQAHLNIYLEEKQFVQDEVNVTAKRESISPAVQELEERDLEKMPNLYSDVLRSVSILPGVTSNNELSSGYNVRGGNYDENLIYLNGYEIYRPMLLRQGVEESQTLVNQDLTGGLKFYGGAFPAYFGDKMSSALEIDYNRHAGQKAGGGIRFDLLNAGAWFHYSYDDFNIIGGYRYAYPSLFGGRLQTKGSYKPFFNDYQILVDYKFGKAVSAEFFLVNAFNRFTLAPDNWLGHFQMSRIDVQEVRINYQGERDYRFRTGLAALKLKLTPDEFTSAEISAAVYNNSEEENTDLTGDVFYSQDAYNPEVGREYLKQNKEFRDNSLGFKTYEFKLDAAYRLGLSRLKGGASVRTSDFNNYIYESIEESGKDSILNLPYFRSINQSAELNSYTGYLQSLTTFNQFFQLDAGVRFLYYDYNREFLVSPRAALYFLPDIDNTLSFSWGYYFQPPSYYELKNKTDIEANPLKSQRAVHYILGWEYRHSTRLKYQFELYYKDLDRLIPYYYDKLTIEYGDNNSGQGYAYGFDFQFQGELAGDMKTWLGYSYLSTAEKMNGNITFNRRLLDQTHTIRIFIQDKMPKIPELQAHTRISFGTGFLFHPYTTITDEETGKNFITADLNTSEEYPFYFRADMGLSYQFKMGNYSTAVVKAEVLNVFNKYNIADYSWFHLFPFNKYPVRVAQIFSKRFFNVGLEITI